MSSPAPDRAAEARAAYRAAFGREPLIGQPGPPQPAAPPAARAGQAAVQTVRPPPCAHLGAKRPGQPAVCQWTCLYDCELLTDAAGDPLACRPSERFGWDGDGPKCPVYAVKLG